MRIVICEDNEDMILLLEIMLRGYGHSVSTLMHAWDFFRPEVWVGVDVAVVDYMMPGVDGGAVLRFLKAEYPEIRRVLSTADTAVPDAVRRLADRTLIKPYDEIELERALHA